MVGPNEHDVAHAGRHKLNTPENKRTHQYLAKFGIGLQDRQHLVAIKLDHLAVLGDAQA
jgi:hypothetical protein